MDRVRVRITVRVTDRFRLRLTARDCRYCKPYIYGPGCRYCIQEVSNMAIKSHETESWTLNSRITISYCVSLIIYLSMSMICERLMLYVRLASPVAVCISIRCRYTRLAWLANPNPNPTNPSHGYSRVYTASCV